METINLGAADGLPPVDWNMIREQLGAATVPDRDAHNARSTWLVTINDDGSPHVTAVGAVWADGTHWFQTGRTTRKNRNLERDPRCSLSVSIDGADVIVEGTATRVTDPDALASVTQEWASGGWPAEPDPSGEGITAPFNAPGLGPPPWFVYRIDASSARVVLTDGPGGFSRFRF